MKKPIFEIPVEGSLGLLAYGDIGLRAWRKIKEEEREITDEEET